MFCLKSVALFANSNSLECNSALIFQLMLKPLYIHTAPYSYFLNLKSSLKLRITPHHSTLLHYIWVQVGPQSGHKSLSNSWGFFNGNDSGEKPVPHWMREAQVPACRYR